MQNSDFDMSPCKNVENFSNNSNQLLLNSISSGKFKNKKCLVNIFFLDNSSKVFLVDGNATIETMIPTVLKRLNIPLIFHMGENIASKTDFSNNSSDNNTISPFKRTSLSSYFGLYESKDGLTIEGQNYDNDERLIDILDSWGQTHMNQYKMVFMIRLFVPCLMSLETKNEILLRQQKIKVQNQDTLLRHSSRSSKKIKFQLTSSQENQINNNSINGSTEATNDSNQDNNALINWTYEEYLNITQITNDHLFYLQFIQAVYTIISDNIPLSKEDALQFGALYFIYKFGIYNSSIHIKGFLSRYMTEFIPQSHLHKNSLLNWESDLLHTIATTTNSLFSTDEIDHYRNNNDSDENDYMKKSAQLQYMKLYYQSEFYGCSLFYGHILPTSTCNPLQQLLSLHKINNSNNIDNTSIATGINSDDMDDHCIILFVLNYKCLKLYTKNYQLIKIFNYEDHELSRWGYLQQDFFFIEIKESLLNTSTTTTSDMTTKATSNITNGINNNNNHNNNITNDNNTAFLRRSISSLRTLFSKQWNRGLERVNSSIRRRSSLMNNNHMNNWTGTIEIQNCHGRNFCNLLNDYTNHYVQNLIEKNEFFYMFSHTFSTAASTSNAIKASTSSIKARSFIGEGTVKKSVNSAVMNAATTGTEILSATISNENESTTLLSTFHNNTSSSNPVIVNNTVSYKTEISTDTIIPTPTIPAQSASSRLNKLFERVDSK